MLELLKTTEGQVDIKQKQRRVIVGIPVHNDFPYFKDTIEALYNSTNFPFTLIVVESESKDGSQEYAKLLPKLYPKKDVEIIHTKKEGPLKAYNKLFEKALEYESDLYLIQTDVIHFRLYRRDWLFEMNQIATNETIGLIAPYGAWGIAGKEYAQGFNWIGGWACYIPLRTIELIGGYDSNYPKGWGVDIDYSANVVQHGLKQAYAPFWVQHHMLNNRNHEADEDAEKLKKQAAEYFRKKYKLDGGT